MKRISPTTARRIFLSCQGLMDTQNGQSGPAAAAGVVRRLGYVQIDTISVVQRAHHHTIWARQGDYTPTILDTLLSETRDVFEYWVHAASYAPMSDYRFYLPVMDRASDIHGHVRHALSAHKVVVDEVRRRIEVDGPMGARDFKDAKKRGPWWDWKPAKMALEALFAMGELMVTARRGFQRIYDLRQRVLPADVDTTMPTEDEWGRFAVRRALGTWGILPADKIHWAYHRTGVTSALADMKDAGGVTEVAITGTDSAEPLYVLSDVLKMSPKRSRKTPQMHILSPFDSAVIGRKRLLEWFNYDFRLECYLPEAKRRWGYFSLPILWGDRFVARMDAKAHRRDHQLEVRNFIFEEGFDEFDAFWPSFRRRLVEFAHFNECTRLTVTKTCPKPIRAALKDVVD